MLLAFAGHKEDMYPDVLYSFPCKERQLFAKEKHGYRERFAKGFLFREEWSFPEEESVSNRHIYIYICVYDPGGHFLYRMVELGYLAKPFF